MSSAVLVALVLAFVGALTAPLSASAVTIYAPPATIPFGGISYVIGINSTTGIIYNPLYQQNVVVAYNPSTGTQVSIPVANSPQAVAVNEATNTIYVTDTGNNSVSVIDGSSNTLIKTIALSDGVTYVGVNPVTNTMYAIGRSHIFVISGATNTLTKTITLPTGLGLYQVAVNPVTNMIYVSESSGTAVLVLDGSSATTHTIPLAAATIAIDTTSNTLYAVLANGDLYTIDGATEVATKVASTGVTYNQGLAINHATNTIVVTGLMANIVKIVDSQTYAQTNYSATGAYLPVFNRTTNELYVSSSSAQIHGIFDFAPAVAPTFTSTVPTSATLDTAYSTSVTTTGTAPITLSESGALPAGMSFNQATGILSGTPTQTGSFLFTISATNAAGTTRQASTIVVSQKPAITSTVTPTATVGSPYDSTATASGTVPITFAENGALPPGIHFTTATGELSGTPTAAGSYPISITATNAAGTSAAQRSTITVSDAPAITLSSGSTAAGGAVIVKGTGYASGERVEIRHSPGHELLATVEASSTGTFTVQATIPSGQAAGRYTITALGLTSGVSQSADIGVTVASPPAPILGYTGTNPAGLVVAALAFLLSGVAAMLLRRWMLRSRNVRTVVR